MRWHQSKKAVSLALLGSIATSGTLAVAPLLTAKQAVAQQFCQCTTYVANRFGLSGYPHAGDWNDGFLQRNGFSQVPPQRGAVVVMERSFPGSDSNYGHVGIVENVRSDGRIEVRGANQSVGSNLFTEAGCSNVRVTAFGTPVNGRRDISFWVRGSSNPTPQPGGFNQVNFSGWVMSTNGITLRNSPRLADRSNQTVAYRQTLSFDGWMYGETVTDLALGTPDARWFRIAGTSFWVPSAYINGNPPNSRPMP
jgi:surface antigen